MEGEAEKDKFASVELAIATEDIQLEEPEYLCTLSCQTRSNKFNNCAIICPDCNRPLDLSGYTINETINSKAILSDLQPLIGS